MDDQAVICSQLPVWQQLNSLAQSMQQRSILGLFDEDPRRLDKHVLRLDGLRLDFSKHNIDDTILAALIQLARDCQVESWIVRQRRGEAINCTEQRAALHTALRQSGDAPCFVDQQDVIPGVHQELDAMAKFVAHVHDGSVRGHTGKPFRHVVNIGIGGSDLGPRVVVDALRNFRHPHIHTHFVANVDDADLDSVLSQVDPETTLFLVASKTFTTQETMLNACSARDWLVSAIGEKAFAEHFVALSTNREQVEAFSIPSSRQFKLWDWVGGRYSLWSSIGLSIALSIGMDGFRALLAGAERMDQHFLNTPLESNLPVRMALTGIWNHNFLGASSQAILPYDERLRLFPAYLQQLDMESNGKSVDRHGNPLSHTSGPVLWGGAGTHVQHSFLQSLHQGTQTVPVDFIAVLACDTSRKAHHEALLSNCFAQAEALMRGRHGPDLPPYKHMPGNRPSTMLLLDELTPETLGSLIALYEHKVFVQGVIWGINSFDQWGVELGKQLGRHILQELQGHAEPDCHDASTNALIHAAKNH